ISHDLRPIPGSNGPFRPHCFRLSAHLRNAGRYFAAGVTSVGFGPLYPSEALRRTGAARRPAPRRATHPSLDPIATLLPPPPGASGVLGVGSARTNDFPWS